jgi:hypothetical protein
MQRESFSIGLVCGLGALIGSLIGLELASYLGSHLKWWCTVAGMLVGGIIAYVAIDFRHFRAGVARAWRETRSWQPDALAWRGFGYTMLASITAFGTLFLYAAAAAICFAPSHWREISLFCIACYLGGLLISSIPAVACNFHKETSIGQGYWSDCQKDIALFAMRHLNPVSAPFWLSLQIFKALRWICFTAIPFIAVEGTHFVKQAFIYAHSTRRTICFVDAGLGALVGFASGNALIGAVAGAMLGVINYQIVAVWWLKLHVRR